MLDSPENGRITTSEKVQSSKEATKPKGTLFLFRARVLVHAVLAHVAVDEVTALNGLFLLNIFFATYTI